MKTRNVFTGIVIAVALGSCAGPAADSGTFVLDEYDIVGPTELAAETEAVMVANSGEYPHTLVVTDHSGEVMAATSLIDPGENIELDLDLEAGLYNFTCRIVIQTAEGDLIDHYEQGMNRAVVVKG